MNTCKPKMTTCENQSGRVCFILCFPSTESENLPGKNPAHNYKKPTKVLLNYLTNLRQICNRTAYLRGHQTKQNIMSNVWSTLMVHRKRRDTFDRYPIQ